MIDATFLKNLTKEYPSWMKTPSVIEIGGEEWVAATTGNVAAAVRRLACQPVDGLAADNAKMRELLPPLLDTPAPLPLDYAAFKAWVGQTEARTTTACPQCSGKGRYDCSCENACCRGYVDPCDRCDGTKGVECEREARYALLGGHYVNRTLLADVFPFLNGEVGEVRIGLPEGKKPFIVRAADWRVLFMPTNRLPEDSGTGEAFEMGIADNQAQEVAAS